MPMRPPIPTIVTTITTKGAKTTIETVVIPSKEEESKEEESK